MKRVLFFCKNNACCSIIAEAFAKRFGKGALNAYSAGTNPAEKMDPMASAVMKERGFDTEGLGPKGFASVPVKKFDLFVHFGGLDQDILKGLGAAEVRDWGDIADPSGKQYADHRKAREDIGARVMGLIREFRGGK